MPAPTTPEPPDSDALDEALPVAPAAGGPAGGSHSTPEPDLAAVPAFLRDRPAGAPARAVIHRPAPAIPDVASLPMLGIAPRRLVLLGLSIVLVWMVASFGRQVTEATAASARADELRAANAALAVEVEALARELQTIGDQRFIQQAARAYRLGTANEIPFALEAGAPDLPADAPGSASVRIGSEVKARSALDSWLDVLFGPGD